MNSVCVIGGNRYFGRRVIERLRDAGTDVTVINRGSSPAPEGVRHLIADRDDEDGLREALADRSFDVVIDQVCYTPPQAAAARRVFAGRTRRYVMTSTIEVYSALDTNAPVTEDVIDLATLPVRMDLPWHEPDFVEEHYGAGKAQAEAVFAREPVFDFVSVRTGHVMGGADFTGRLDHYTTRIRDGLPVVVHREPRPSSFINSREIADFLVWTAESSFTGPVNACSHGPFDVTYLCDTLSAAAGAGPVTYTTGRDTSPFSFDRAYAMDNGRAVRLGFVFSHTADWLPHVISEALACV
ncbi:nucleoside-diphosphate-sugar epimerase [Nonomuraea polychroma]|uniref:Nucleoside-diphosphate-sugar epimerase n=1 Tax=Nonomuraea polychroma TaxID=46176 RepID=A0A438MM02_9ACTN|nr:NAD-dependent epimerase/dehydratase family protein [Nonomuraea polychroma]RVX46625.1 nucleoside-diphosphate-sugar epimerase [Nonomuraea polychroma]